MVGLCLFCFGFCGWVLVPYFLISFMVASLALGLVNWFWNVWLNRPIANHTTKHNKAMMTSSNGNIFRVTGHDVFFDLHPNKRLSKQRWGWWNETPLCPLWRDRNGANCVHMQTVNICVFRCTVFCWLIDKTAYKYEPPQKKQKSKPEHWRTNIPKLQNEFKIKVLI